MRAIAVRFGGILLAVVFLSVMVPQPVAAQSNSIDNVFVSTPACDGFEGRLSITFTIDSTTNRYLWNNIGTSGDDLGFEFGTGTHTALFQFIPREGTSPHEVLTILIEMGTQPYVDDLDSYVFSFHCDTGEIIIGATGPITTQDHATTTRATPVRIDVAANDIDLDGNLDPSSVTVPITVRGGTVSNPHDGTLIYTPDPSVLDSGDFIYKICDTTNYCSLDRVNIEIVGSINHVPDCPAARPSVAMIWPANKLFKPVKIVNVSDPDGDAVAIVIIYVYQDEPVTSHVLRETDVTSPDAFGIGTQTAQVRAERSGYGGGRFYHIGFIANDGQGGACEGEVRVVVPTDPNKLAFDGGPLYNSAVSS